MKTYVKFKSDEIQGIAKEGDNGYIDGYVHGGDNCPYAIVVSNGRLAFATLYQLEVIDMKPTE